MATIFLLVHTNMWGWWEYSGNWKCGVVRDVVEETKECSYRGSCQTLAWGASG